MVYLEGLWSYIHSGTMPYTLPLLHLQMALIFTLTQASHYVLKRYGVPRFPTQLLVGIILGPSLLGRFSVFNNILFLIKGQEILGMLSLMSYMLFNFVNTVKMDVGMIKRTGKKTFVIGVACILSPFLIGFSVQVKLGGSWLKIKEADVLSFITIGHCMTPFPVVAWLLEDLDILNSELGRLGLSVALVSDVLSVFLTVTFTLTRISQNEGSMLATIDLGAIIVYLIVIVFAIRPAMLWIIRQTPEGRHVENTYIHIIMLMVLGSGLLSHALGQTLLFGPFFLGLAVPDGPPLGSAIVNKLKFFIWDVFLPIFVTTCGMRTDLSLIKFDSSFMTINGILIILTFVAKVVACLAPSLYSKMPLNDAMTLTLVLSCKGVVQLCIYTYFRDTEILTDQVYALLSVDILLIAIFVPLLVKFLYNPTRQYASYQKRNIMHCVGNTELRILVCIHKPDNIAAISKLLEVLCSSRERPLFIYVLHLIELIGRASPIFISHQMQKKSVFNSLYSENVILAFNHFEQDNQGAALVDIFTTISPFKHMHDDKCILGMDKLTSLIVLPFHRKWSIDGSVESEDSTIRTLNCNVLELAPCSVGILVDRGHLGRPMVSLESSCSVAMIFLGGSDDREALTFAKRMANNLKIILTVFHFVATSNDGNIHRDKLLDYEILNDLKLNSVYDEYVIFIEEIVKDGAQTASIVRCMVKEYDLIIVGRQHNVVSPQTSGLAEWSEFPELGIIGDLLTSSDLNSGTSVLVVQQQKIKT